MRKNTCMALSLFMIASCVALILPASSSSDEQVQLTVYIHDGDLEGDPLCCVQITGQDGAGNSIGGITDSDGAVTFEGQTGTWEFEFEKDGYEPLYIEYDVTESHQAAAYMEPAESSTSLSEPVALTVYVHDSSLDGALLSDVQIIGNDGAGYEFSGITDASGSVTLEGQPGIWDFLFQKDNYDTLSLTYEVNETHEAAAYLQPSA
jgi:hypothetical protein